MTSLFLFALILGGGLLGLSLLGDLFGGADTDFDTDFDADFEADFDTDLGADLSAAPGLDADAGAGTDLASATKLFTIRNLTYFLFGFGAVGWLLVVTRPDLAMWLVTAAAVSAGVLSAGIAAVAFGWLKATESGWQAGEASWVGCEGRVVLPVTHGKPGQIIVTRGDREHELRALPFERGAPMPESWRNVVVIEMEGGTARVSPLEALAPADPGRVES